VEKEGLQRAAVTNAPRKNAELMISLLGLSSFFEIVIIGGECERSKPFPDPYQNALKHFGLSPHEAFVLEVMNASSTRLSQSML
jgi:beta-phosphoglucomutase-like phosphatase (HAD superfamily)